MTTIRENLTPILERLKYKIVNEKTSYNSIEFVITLDVFGTYIRLKKFKDEDFLYIDGFIYLEKPIPTPTMVILHTLVDNHLRIGINIDNKTDVEEDMIRNILIHDRIYKDNITINDLDHSIVIIYNCMTKVTGMVMGLGNSIIIKREMENGRLCNVNEDLKSYG